MAYSFNIRVTLKLTIKKAINITLLLILYTNLKLLYNYLIKLSTT